MRYLGERIPLNAEVPWRSLGEVVSDLKHGQERVRIHHSVNGNLLKL